jgi:hypothetical protein
VRRLAQPQVVKSAIIAATLSAALCLPRMWLWDKLPLWYSEATIFLGGFVLWAFVFAWHTEYTRRPVFTLKIKPFIFVLATLAGVLGAIGMHFLLDPTLRQINPEEYPGTWQLWLAATLFALAFTQLFLVFAPYAWAVRLFRNEYVAACITITFGVMVWLLKVQSSQHVLPAMLLIELLALRIVQAFFAVWFYQRGGILLVWWIGFLGEARHLLTLHH